MKFKCLGLVALLLCFGVEVRAAAVFPTIDGGPFDSTENSLLFTVTGGNVAITGTGFSATPVVGGAINVDYLLTGNSAGPVPNITIDFDGTIGADLGGGFYAVSGNAILLGDGVPELTLTVSDGLFNLAASSTLYLSFSAATIDPPIAAGTISFLPVTFNAPSLGYTTTSDFFLGSGSETSPSTSLAVGRNAGPNYGVITSGSAQGLVNPVPEPASMLTLLGCVTGACVMGRRRRKALAAA